MKDENKALWNSLALFISGVMFVLFLVSLFQGREIEATARIALSLALLGKKL